MWPRRGTPGTGREAERRLQKWRAPGPKARDVAWQGRGNRPGLRKKGTQVGRAPRKTPRLREISGRWWRLWGKMVQSVGRWENGRAGAGGRGGLMHGCRRTQVDARRSAQSRLHRRRPAPPAPPGAAASQPRSPTACPDARGASRPLARCLRPPHGRLLPPPAAHAPPTGALRAPSLLAACAPGSSASPALSLGLALGLSVSLVPRPSLSGSLDLS